MTATPTITAIRWESGGGDSVTRYHSAIDSLPPARIAAEVLRIGETLLAKNADYGSSAHKPPALAPHLDPGAAILVRMSDKIARIVSLTKPGFTANVDESLDDTFRDLAGYCVLWLTRPKS
jgi:hypothetical protein